MFMCTNQKEPHKSSCANHHAKEMLDYAKQQAVALGLTKELKFRISSSGCMGRCSDGPVLVIYPQGLWYNYKTREDIDKILQDLAAGKAMHGNLTT
jgi:(2Fe-2S) ferredoxin